MIEEYMIEEFIRLFIIKPSQARFDLDRIITDLPRQALVDVDPDSTNQTLIDSIREAKGVLLRWRGLCVVNIQKYQDDSPRIDATMNDQRARTIIYYLDEQRYLFRIKFKVALPATDVTWIIRDKRDPVRESHRAGDVVTLSKNSKPGLRTGVFKPYYERAYPVTAVLYAIYPLND